MKKMFGTLQQNVEWAHMATENCLTSDLHEGQTWSFNVNYVSGAKT